MKGTLWTIALVGLFGLAGSVRADDKNANQNKNANQGASGANQAKGAKEAFLGVSVEPISPALRSHLTNLPEGQGVMVAHVAKDSPAAKAGLQSHDILLSFGNHKLSSPEELVKAVRSDTPGQMANVSYLRAGKTASCQVTLGERPRMAEEAPPNVYRFYPNENFFEEFEATGGESGWTSFEGMSLKRTGEHQWAAEIEFRNKDGQKETKKFTGSREEIRKAIQNQKDLPADEQRHLLRALDLQRRVFEFHFPNPNPNSGTNPGGASDRDP